MLLFSIQFVKLINTHTHTEEFITLSLGQSSMSLVPEFVVPMVQFSKVYWHWFGIIFLLASNLSIHSFETLKKVNSIEESSNLFFPKVYKN